MGCASLFACGGGVFRLRRRRLIRRWLGLGGLASGAGGAALLPAFFFFRVLIELFRHAEFGLVFGVLHKDTEELAGEADGDIVDDALEVRR